MRALKYASKQAFTDRAVLYLAACTDKKEMQNKAGLRFLLGISRDTYAEYKKKYPKLKCRRGGEGGNSPGGGR